MWSTAVNPKRRRVHRAVRDMAWLPGPESLWTSVWKSTQRAEVTEDDWKGLVQLKWMILVFLGVVTGLEELEGFGRE